MPLLSEDDLRNWGVYFYFHDEKYEATFRHHAATAIAEGLRLLKIPTYSNVHHPRFVHEDIEPPRRHLYVFVVTDVTYSPGLVEAIERYPAQHKLVENMADNGMWMAFPDNIP